MAKSLGDPRQGARLETPRARGRIFARPATVSLPVPADQRWFRQSTKMDVPSTDQT